VSPLFRRSATEVMTLAKDPAEHRRSYLLGLRGVPLAPVPVPQGAAAGDAPAAPPGLDARTTGDIVHAVMELDAEALERDLDAVLEREVTRRLGDEAAAGLPSAALARLRRLVEETRAHAAVARLLDGEAVEHELAFTWFPGPSGDGGATVLHGSMDLVARVGGTLEVLDFKTHRIRPGMEAATAATYDVQRDLYAVALAEVLEAPAAFSFFFPETGGEVRVPFAPDAVAAARAAIVARLDPALVGAARAGTAPAVAS
jgi:ATP-dependent exoDNAse (exonuclease V) beta subunit